MTKDVIKKIGKKTGKTLAVFSGVHGNEKAGVIAMKKIVKEVEIVAGQVYFVFANPVAIEKNIRQIEKNLNRCFIAGNKDETLEGRRARELMPILDECDALLDLHASPNENSTPFIIAEKGAHDLATKLDFEILSWGWDVIEPGATDGYMYWQGKPAICLECGSITESNGKANLAEKSVYQFLQYYGCISKNIPYSQRQQKKIEAKKAVFKITNDFYFTKKFADFEILVPGEVFARDGKQAYIAGENECIIFPHPETAIGEEVFVIGRVV